LEPFPVQILFIMDLNEKKRESNRLVQSRFKLKSCLSEEIFAEQDAEHFYACLMTANVEILEICVVKYESVVRYIVSSS
jgi:CO dehydrogenase/acetyl-CoA synthase beta subunit